MKRTTSEAGADTAAACGGVPAVSTRSSRRAWLGLWPVVGLAGCAGLSGESSRAPRPDVAPAPPAPRTLAAEERRLSAALDGTPVSVERTSAGLLQLRVPLEFCFERRRSAVRPPLAAVLDRVATGLRPPPGFNLQVRASADAGAAGGDALALDRAASVRDYLVAKGVPRLRIVQTGVAAQAQVELLISERGG